MSDGPVPVANPLILAKAMRKYADELWAYGFKETSEALHAAARKLEADVSEPRGECDWTHPLGSA